MLQLHLNVQLEVDKFGHHQQSNEMKLYVEPNHNKYKENKTGPKIEPWGILMPRGALLELQGPRLTEKVWPVQCDSNHLITVPLMPTRFQL